MSREKENDRKLIKRLIAGDALAFDKIFEKYNRKIYAFSLKNLRNREDAEGVVQEVFLNLWKDREKLKEINNLEAWLFTLSFNTIRKIFRKLASKRDYLRQTEFNKSMGANSTITAVEYNDILAHSERIIQKLPKRHGAPRPA